ncbi:hypothetical protein FoTM2_007785 [Fusarium oxysporum f. sp. vasinfectum]|nr:hypothetical protein FoTM2_007785 [Fusarium oxysporum f. sp. vasinfectum]
MDVSVSSRAQSSATSSSSSVLPSDSASQFASTLSEPEASSTEHTVKRRKLRAIATWDHFRGAQGDEPRAISGNLLHYCKRCRNPSWSTHISSNARYHLKKAHHIFVREDSSSQNKRQLAIENAFARTTARQLQQVREHERNTLRSVINVDAFREAQMLLSAHRHLPLNFVTWPEYQALLTAVNPAVQEFLTDSGNTVAADLDRAYDAHQQSVKKWLEHARSLVHIAMDATLEQQMEWASIDQVLENMDILFLQFENAKSNINLDYTSPMLEWLSQSDKDDPWRGFTVVATGRQNWQSHVYSAQNRSQTWSTQAEAGLQEESSTG